MSQTYAAEVEIVLVGYEDLNNAEDELEEVMLKIGFKKSLMYYVGTTELLPSELETYIRTHLFGKLTHSDDFSVHVVNQGQRILR